MRAPVLVRLLARPRTLWDLYVGGCIVLFLILFARLGRDSFAPLADERAFVQFIAGALAFATSAAIGSLAAHRIFEVETCAYSASLPSLARNGRTGILTTGALCTAIAAGVGFAFAPDLGNGAVLALLAAIGFGFAVLASDPANGALRRHGFLTILGFLGVAYFVPEIAAITSDTSWAWLAGAIAIGTALVLATLTPERRRERALTTAATLDRAYAEMDLRSGRWGAARRAPRDGRARFEGTRRTDADWIRVALHEWNGTVRGGWVAASVARAAISSVCILALHYMATRKVPGADSAIDRLALSIDRSDLVAAPPFFLALWVSIVVIGSPALAVHDAHRPVARARRARIAWLATTVEDVLHVVLLIVLLAGVALTIEHQTAIQAATNLRVWIGSAVAVFTCVPFARWLRLAYLDTAYENPGPVRQGVATGAAVILMSGGSCAIVLGLHEARRVPELALVIAAVVVLVLTRAVWLVALKRHHARRDLAT